MNEQFIYIVQATSKYNPQYSTIKVGFTADPTKRLQQLRSRNKYFDYSEMALFKHNAKLIGYKHDEQKIHQLNLYHRVGIGKEYLPEGYTEHYESYYIPELYEQLTGMGYYWANEPVQQPTFFEWN